MKKLFIGLGGLGCEVVRCRAMSTKSHNDYYFFFNNDLNAIKEYSNLLEKDVFLRENAFIFNLSHNLKHIIHAFGPSEIESYFNNESKHMLNMLVSGVNYGASGIRVFSRISFEYFAKKEDLRRTINSFIDATDSVTVVIVSSLCGSFGSSIILPLAAKIKSLMLDAGIQDYSVDVNVVGISEKAFSLAFQNGMMQYAKANTYATVREIHDIINIKNLKFQVNIPEIYDPRKNQKKHINQFLILEPADTTSVYSTVSCIAHLLTHEVWAYVQCLETSGLKQANIISNNEYVKSYHDTRTQLHIDVGWEKEKPFYNRSFPITVFLSYSSADNALADIIDEYIMRYPNVKVSRYTRDVGYKGSFKDFMKSLNRHDYVIAIISDNYLKSRACMYEVGELIKDDEFKKKIIFMVLDANDNKYYNSAHSNNAASKIYTVPGRVEYIRYWENEYKKLDNEIKLIESENAKIELLQVLREIRKIIDHDLSPFLQYLSDYRGRTFDEMYQSGFIELIKELGLPI